MAVTAEDFKTALRSWPSGVTVVTARDDEASLHRAVTVSAFSSVSLEPPLVVVGIGNESRTLGCIKKSGRFAVSILAAGQADVSRLCSQPDRAGLDGVAHSVSTGGCALVEGAIVHLECNVHDVVLAGDHQLVVGLVTATSRAPEGAPLLYWERHYGVFTSTD